MPVALPGALQQTIFAVLAGDAGLRFGGQRVSLQRGIGHGESAAPTIFVATPAQAKGPFRTSDSQQVNVALTLSLEFASSGNDQRDQDAAAAAENAVIASLEASIVEGVAWVDLGVSPASWDYQGDDTDFTADGTTGRTLTLTFSCVVAQNNRR